MGESEREREFTSEREKRGRTAMVASPEGSRLAGGAAAGGEAPAEQRRGRGVAARRRRPRLTGRVHGFERPGHGQGEGEESLVWGEMFKELN